MPRGPDVPLSDGGCPRIPWQELAECGISLDSQMEGSIYKRKVMVIPLNLMGTWRKPPAGSSGTTVTIENQVAISTKYYRKISQAGPWAPLLLLLTSSLLDPHSSEPGSSKSHDLCRWTLRLYCINSHKRHLLWNCLLYSSQTCLYWEYKAPGLSQGSDSGKGEETSGPRSAPAWLALPWAPMVVTPQFCSH